MRTHTPGPWHFDAPYVEDPTGTRVASITGRPEASANGRLTAAAPELLEALQFVMSAHGEQLHDAFDAANAAITKATQP